MSQKALAEALGMTQPSVWKIEKGTTDTSGVELGTLIKLAKALQCEVEDLVVGVDATYDIWRRDLPDHGINRDSNPHKGGSIVAASAASSRIQQLEQQLRERDRFISQVEDAAIKVVRL